MSYLVRVNEDRLCMLFVMLESLRSSPGLKNAGLVLNLRDVADDEC